MNGTPLSRRGLLLGAALTPAAHAFDFGMGTKGSGESAQREFALGEFDEIDIGGSITIELQQLQPPRVLLETDANLLPMFDASVHDRTLRLRWRGSVRPTRLKLAVNVWNLKTLSASGSASIASAALAAKRLALHASGAARIDLPALTAEAVNLKQSGSSHVVLGGRANELELALGGSARLDASALQTSRVHVALGGSSLALVQASQSIGGSLGGSSELRHGGDAAVELSRGGSARFRKL